jgi:hypothetical protein
VHLCAPHGHAAAVTGAQLIDDEYLRSIGATDEDLVKYRVDPAVEPPRLLAPGGEGSGGAVGAGGVRDPTPTASVPTRPRAFARRAPCLEDGRYVSHPVGRRSRASSPFRFAFDERSFDR